MVFVDFCGFWVVASEVKVSLWGLELIEREVFEDRDVAFLEGVDFEVEDISDGSFSELVLKAILNLGVFIGLSSSEDFSSREVLFKSFSLLLLVNNIETWFRYPTIGSVDVVDVVDDVVDVVANFVVVAVVVATLVVVAVVTTRVVAGVVTLPLLLAVVSPFNLNTSFVTGFSVRIG